ncbi:MAG: VOC family protein [Paracoccus sp. (in: a-proteobacteria)]
MSFHGNPCWYELGTSDLNGATAFYSRILGWNVQDSGMPDFTYLLARMGEVMVAGMMDLAGQSDGVPPNWIIYFAVDDCDKATADITLAGGRVYKEPADIPDTGRFAIVSDPQGAVFGILQPDMSQMSEADIVRAAESNPFDQRKAGHANWNELMSPDPEAGFTFYAGLFGWTKGDAVPMGNMGAYQLFRHKGTDIGAMMGLGDAPVPNWLPYFGVDGSVTTRTDDIRAAGGKVHHGPAEVPGPAYITIAQDPQGAWFAIVGAEK